MPDAFDLAKRIRDVSEETHRQAESLRRRAEQTRSEGIVGEMLDNARERERDAEFLRDLADSIERHSGELAASFVDEIARDALR